MNHLLLFSAVVILSCVASSKILYRLGLPALLIFLALGMLSGSDGIGGIYFDNYDLSETICSIALIFIMFYGGFGTNFQAAKPIMLPAILLSSAGTILTALLTGLFCNFALKIPFLEAMLIGAITASTDAASVFSILRSRKLNLKNGLASLLEIESGSNDPFAYMLTVVILALITGDTELSIPVLLAKQLGIGLAFGFILAFLSMLVLKHVRFEIDAFYSTFVMAVAVLAYALSNQLGGNGYLCVYVCGFLLGNSKIPKKRDLFHFLDGISWLFQIILFFLLGLLSFPSKMPTVLLSSVCITIFMIVVVRPIVTFSILNWFRFPIKDQLLVSWVGIRGAASIVFAIFTVTADVAFQDDIFHIVFFIVLFSVALQGTLIPFFAKKLNLVEEESSVLKTFNDYGDEIYQKLYELTLAKENSWCGKMIMETDLPQGILIIMIKRGADIIVPDGSVQLLPGDILVLSGNNLEAFLPQLSV